MGRYLQLSKKCPKFAARSVANGFVYTLALPKNSEVVGSFQKRSPTLLSDIFITCSENFTSASVSVAAFWSNAKKPVAGGLVLGQNSLTSYLRIDVRKVIRRTLSHLLGRVLDETDTSLDVGLEALDGFVQKFLLVVIGGAEDVDGLLGSVGLLES